MELRNGAFDRGLLSVTEAGVPVIAVGNLTTGGTGKTPLVELLVEWLLQRGTRVAVISRGYGRRSQGVVVVSDGSRLLVDAAAGGDEPVQIARKFPGARVVVGEKRVQAARTAVEELSANVLVLDDAFQHRYLARSLDLVVVDGDRDLTREPLLPAGRRREPLGSLRRADIVAVSRGEESALQPWTALFERFPSTKVIRFTHRLHSVRRADDHREERIDNIRLLPFVAFSGIGRPERFVRDLEGAGFIVADHVAFRDHHWFTAGDIDQLAARVQRTGARGAMTTEKDVMRLSAERNLLEHALRRFTLYYVRVGVQITAGESTLRAAVERAMEDTKRS